LKRTVDSQTALLLPKSRTRNLLNLFKNFIPLFKIGVVSIMHLIKFRKKLSKAYGMDSFGLFGFTKMKNGWRMRGWNISGKGGLDIVEVGGSNSGSMPNILFLKDNSWALPTLYFQPRYSKKESYCK
jgi:hypothetical protein